MASVSTSSLLKQLRLQIVAAQYKAEDHFGGQSADVLSYTPQPGTWSALQCLEHLNTYGRFYLPALDKAITAAERNGSQPLETFKSSWLGAWFTKQMQPTPDGKLRSRMKSPKGHLPAVQPDAAGVLSEFIRQQETMEALMDRAAKINLQKAKVPTSLSGFIKLSVGDTFGFMTAHINRHVLQAENVIRRCPKRVEKAV
ncbi:DinB family protein [Chitinophaga oryzae]|uniref:DinB family protein n=1 Tax=Chitinophaga oryzae TaxID=2725414 RepID=A0AAE6ZKH5_9BACT|nr:DinB family protein [Chitinophaga oryzae]QJB34706.1 DinB family protein [Chitinophaga oryzae]QJB41223.1 DinB family protein [Chitinophaga oryzae]